MYSALKGTAQDDRPNPVIAAWISEGQHLSGPASIQSTKSFTTSADISSKNPVSVKKERPNESVQSQIAEPEALAASSGPVGASQRSLSRTASLGRQKSQKFRTGRSHAEACSQVLFRNYLDLVDRDLAQGMQKFGMDEPGGLSSLALIVCPSLLDDALSMLASGFVIVAPVISMVGWLLILLILWSTRLVCTKCSPALALLLLLTGIVCLLAAEQVALASAAEEAVKSQSGGLRPSVGQAAAATSHRGYAYFQATAQASGSSGASANPGDAAGYVHKLHAPAANANATVASAASGSSSSATTSGGGKPGNNAGVLKAVRASMTLLEAELYGNDMTDGLLPVDVLLSRVQKLCEDVGIPGLKQGAGVADMLKALQRAEAEVGV